MISSPRVATVLGYVGANVRRLRLAKGLTQAELAKAARLDQRFLQRVERGQTNVGVEAIVMLADVLGVPPGSLFIEAVLQETKPGRPRKTPREP